MATLADFGGLELLRDRIDELWEYREELSDRDTAVRETVLSVMELLDCGRVRVAEIGPDGEVTVNEWLKRAIVMLFRLCPLERTEAGPMLFADRLPPKRDCGDVRVVPGAYARFGSYLAPGAILMPSFVNVGAYVGSGTLVDTWATVGSCAQVGEHVHLSGGVGVGGVLEPLQASPVIVESDAFVGSRSMLIEGARVGRGAVVGAGVILSPTIPVIDADTGEEISRGHIPDWSVAVGATRPRSFPGGEFGLPCVLVIKRLAEGERPDKVKLNALVRAHGATL
ncbi:MAG TPA: 2,3,4,5-tetrahydropyridine-2,6-dicarboxylate N-succinyltransferase [Solirubrobacteraceae bacterium]|nr:2,3,4,5-tetrahydropyridine-2,6-dicarboxylate N-succinyltransferase [Solirubrobacteraceae bacterium]HYM67937.1 2,3,4,5-tetrahydropyridine-2,6-dicarboxylate N-succinyltransferase [Patescibacteria group bacterium]